MDTIDLVSTGGEYEGFNPRYAYTCEFVGCSTLVDGIALFRPVSRDGEPDHRTDVHLDGDMVLEGQLTAEAPAHLPGDVAAAAKEAAAKSVKPDAVGADGIKH